MLKRIFIVICLLTSGALLAAGSSSKVLYQENAQGKLTQTGEQLIRFEERFRQTVFDKNNRRHMLRQARILDYLEEAKTFRDGNWPAGVRNSLYSANLILAHHEKNRNLYMNKR